MTEPDPEFTPFSGPGFRLGEPEPEPEPEPVIVSDEKTHEYYMGKMKPFFFDVNRYTSDPGTFVKSNDTWWGQAIRHQRRASDATLLTEEDVSRDLRSIYQADIGKGPVAGKASYMARLREPWSILIRNLMPRLQDPRAGAGAPGAAGEDNMVLGKALIYFMGGGYERNEDHHFRDKPPDPPWGWELYKDKVKMKWVYKDNKGSAEPIYPKRIRDGHWSPGPWDMNPSKEGDRKDGCSICFETSGKQDKWCTTICGHSFHKECLFRALEKKPACPLCRRDLQYMKDSLTTKPGPAPPRGNEDILLKLLIISVVICEYIYYASLVGDTDFFKYLAGEEWAQASAVWLSRTPLKNLFFKGGDKGEWYNKYYYTGNHQEHDSSRRGSQSDNINTPLLAAISKGHLDIVNILINKLNVDHMKKVKIMDPSSVDIGPYETAMSYAITENNDNQMEIVKLLITKMIENQVSLDSPVRQTFRTRINKTALEVAFDVENIPIITLLIESGADYNLKFSSDYGNKYPLDVALEKNMEGIKDLLERNGATITPPGWWERTVSRMGQCVSPAQCGPGPVLQTDNPLEAEPEPEPETERAAMKKFKKKTKKKKSKLHKSKKKSKKKKTKKRKTRRRRS